MGALRHRFARISPRHAMRRALSLGLAMLVTVAALVSGTSYVWCAPMERAVSSCCCPGSADASEVGADRGGPGIRNACCDERENAELPFGASDRGGELVPPALSTPAPAPLPAFVVVPAAPRLGEPRPSAAQPWRSRAGPSRATDVCVALRVFRC